MLVHGKIGQVNDFGTGKQRDKVWLEWHELNKRIWHKTTEAGQAISLKSLDASPALMEDDVLFEDDHSLVIVDIIPTKAIVVKPSSEKELVALAYEIGNRHLPLFYVDNELVTIFDMPLLRQLKATAYEVREEERKLSNPVQTTVLPHASQLIGANTLIRNTL